MKKRKAGNLGIETQCFQRGVGCGLCLMQLTCAGINADMLSVRVSGGCFGLLIRRQHVAHLQYFASPSLSSSDLSANATPDDERCFLILSRSYFTVAFLYFLAMALHHSQSVHAYISVNQ